MPTTTIALCTEYHTISYQLLFIFLPWAVCWTHLTRCHILHTKQQPAFEGNKASKPFKTQSSVSLFPYHAAHCDSPFTRAIRKDFLLTSRYKTIQMILLLGVRLRLGTAAQSINTTSMHKSTTKENRWYLGGVLCGWFSPFLSRFRCWNIFVQTDQVEAASDMALYFRIIVRLTASSVPYRHRRDHCSWPTLPRQQHYWS